MGHAPGEGMRTLCLFVLGGVAFVAGMATGIWPIALAGLGPWLLLLVQWWKGKRAKVAVVEEEGVKPQPQPGPPQAPGRGDPRCVGQCSQAPAVPRVPAEDQEDLEE